MTVEDLAKQMMFLLEHGKGHYRVEIPIHGTPYSMASESFELDDEDEGVLIY